MQQCVQKCVLKRVFWFLWMASSEPCFWALYSSIQDIVFAGAPSITIRTAEKSAHFSTTWHHLFLWFSWWRVLSLRLWWRRLSVIKVIGSAALPASKASFPFTALKCSWLFGWRKIYRTWIQSASGISPLSFGWWQQPSEGAIKLSQWFENSHAWAVPRFAKVKQMDECQNLF